MFLVHTTPQRLDTTHAFFTCRPRERISFPSDLKEFKHETEMHIRRNSLLCCGRKLENVSHALEGTIREPHGGVENNFHVM